MQIRAQVLLSVVVADKLTERSWLVGACRLLTVVVKLLLHTTPGILIVNRLSPVIALVALTVVSVAPITSLVVVSIICPAPRITLRLVYSLISAVASLGFLVGGSEVNGPTIYVSFLHIMDQMLRYGLFLKGNETKASTGIRVRLPHNLNFLHNTELSKIPRQVLLIQMVIETANEDFIFCAIPLASRSLLLLGSITLRVSPLGLPISRATATTSLLPVPSLLTLIRNLLLRLTGKETIGGLITIAESNLNIATSNRMAILL